MNKLIISSLLAAFFLFACEEEIPTPKKEKAPTSSFVPLPPLEAGEKENVSFEGPRVGQESKYVGFAAIQGRDGRGFGHFKYTDDTLSFKIVSRTNFTFVIEISSTENDVVDTYKMARMDDYVSIKLQSENAITHSFVQAAQLDLATVESPVVNTEIEQFTNQTCSDWPCFASLTSYEQLGKTYEQLNTYADFSSMDADVPGIYAYYRADLGYVRWVGVNSWRRDRSGWDLIVQ